MSQELETLYRELEKAKQKEREWQLRADELTDFIENASLPLHWVDGQGIIIWANKAELEALGYTKEEYIGRHIQEFHADRNVIDDILARLGSKETLKNYPARLKAKDGSIMYVLINSNVLWDEDKFVHTRCFTRDITELKRDQDKKAVLLKEIEEKNRQLKAAFEDLEIKIKFRTIELEKIITLQNEEIKKLNRKK